MVYVALAHFQYMRVVERELYAGSARAAVRQSLVLYIDVVQSNACMSRECKMFLKEVEGELA